LIALGLGAVEDCATMRSMKCGVLEISISESNRSIYIKTILLMRRQVALRRSSLLNSRSPRAPILSASHYVTRSVSILPKWKSQNPNLSNCNPSAFPLIPLTAPGLYRSKLRQLHQLAPCSYVSFMSGAIVHFIFRVCLISGTCFPTRLHFNI